MPDTFLSDETLVSTALKEAGKFFTSFKSQREEYDDKWEVLDYMANCAQNRTIASTEKTKGMDEQDDADGNDARRANTGSTLFYNLKNKMAAQLLSVLQSKDVPFKYIPVYNENVKMSEEDAAAQCKQKNCLAKWTMKQDRFDVKSIEFAHQIKKYGNTPVMIFQNQKTENRKTKTPVVATVQNPDGTVTNVITGYKEEVKEYVVENFPSIAIASMGGI